MRTNDSFTCLTDEELVDKIVLSKNTVLFGVLYDRYSKIVYNKCWSFSRDEYEAQDLTQEVFLKLYVKLGSFNGKSKFFTWLYAFTYNICVNYVNRDVAKKMKDRSVPIEENENLLIETDDFNLFQLKVDKLQKVMEKADPEDKMILLLKYQDDLSIKELVNTLEIGESAVKMRLKRAKARVVKLYNEIN